MNININLFFILLPIIAILPVFLIKNYLKFKNNKYLLYTFISYIGLTYLYINLLKDCDISKIFCISQVIQILLIVIGGFFLYSEKITKNKVIGVSTSFIALYFLSN